MLGLDVLVQFIRPRIEGGETSCPNQRVTIEIKLKKYCCLPLWRRVCVLYSFPMSICEGRRSLILNQQRELEARYSFLEDTEKKYLKRDMFNGFICHSCLLKEKPNRVCRRIMQIRCSASEMPYYFA